MLAFDLIVLIMLILAAIIQTWGAHLESKPCKYVKYSYAVSLIISASIVAYCIPVAAYDHFGHHVALGLIVFNVLLGGTVRLLMLLRQRRECKACER